MHRGVPGTLMIGTHLLVDFHGVAATRLNDVEMLATALTTAAQACGLTPVAAPLMHHFAGGGVTGVILLAESHIALHTYPQYGYIALDVFSCGPADPHIALGVLRRRLAPQHEHVTTCVRGGAMH